MVEATPSPNGPPARGPFLRGMETLEADGRLDRVASAFDTVAHRVTGGRAGPVLRGDWLGHSLHPLLTDFPLGCWLSAGLLDLVGGRRRRDAATRLIGLGLLFVPPTVAAGLAEVPTIGEQRSRRVAAVHATGNTVVAVLYLLSWRARRRGRHGRGVAFGMAGGGLAWVTGYLGGHLSLARRVGTGERHLPVDEAAPAPAAARTEAMIGIGADGGRADEPMAGRL